MDTCEFFSRRFSELFVTHTEVTFPDMWRSALHLELGPLREKKLQALDCERRWPVSLGSASEFHSSQYADLPRSNDVHSHSAEGVLHLQVDELMADR